MIKVDLKFGQFYVKKLSFYMYVFMYFKNNFGCKVAFISIKDHF